jgi:antitoxin VapB
MPSLNIKNEEIHREAHELAKLTGESVTAAVGAAIKERLDRKQKGKKKQNRLEWLIELSNYTAPRLKDLPPSTEIGDLLYDKETGLPL